MFTYLSSKGGDIIYTIPCLQLHIQHNSFKLFEQKSIFVKFEGIAPVVQVPVIAQYIDPIVPEQKQRHKNSRQSDRNLFSSNASTSNHA